MKPKKKKRSKFVRDLIKGLEEYIAHCEGKIKLTVEEFELPKKKKGTNATKRKAFTGK